MCVWCNEMCGCVCGVITHDLDSEQQPENNKAE